MEVSKLIEENEKLKKEIEELKKVIKMVEIYKSYGIPEDAEMVIMCKKDFLRRSNKEFIKTNKIKEIFKKYSEKEDCTYKELIDFVEEIKELLED